MTIAEETPGTTRPPLLPTQEVRIALVLYGGVSLAIYINGVVQELLALVRATAPSATAGEGSEVPLLADQELTGTERVYRMLGKLLSWETKPDEAPPRDEDPIRTRFVVDVISGSSAGGINGIFLGKALANEQDIDELKNLWVEEGDIGLLVNDGEAYKQKDTGSLKKLRPANRPPSLLDGRRMYWKLLAALHGLDEQPPATVSRLMEQLDVWITITDLRGLLLPIELSDRIVYEPRHRSVLNFRYDATEAQAGQVQNDFLPTFNPLLAFAARTTSSFPFAFEPTALEDIDEFVALAEFSAYRQLDSTSALFEGFFADYVKARREEGDTRPTADFYRHDAFADGGYLDNKPFSWALKSIAERHSLVPVERRLVYVEPSPARDYLIASRPDDSNPNEPPPWSVPETRPDVLKNVLAAAHTLPRSEPIRDDLDALVNRNREVARIRAIARIVDRTADEFPEQLLERPPLRVWLRTTSSQLIAEYGLSYAAYHRLKVATVLDELAETVSWLLGLRQDGDENAAVRLVLEAWFRNKYSEQDGTTPTQTRFLYAFDRGYRLRRLRFVGIRIESLLRLDDGALQVLRRFGLEAESADSLPEETQTELRAELRRLKDEFGRLRVDLDVRLRRLSNEEIARRLREGLDVTGLTTSELLAVLPGAAGPEEGLRRAWALIQRNELMIPLTELADDLARELAPIFREIGNAATAAVEGEPDATVAAPARRAVEFFYEQFESYDLVSFPTAYGAVTDATRVDVIRISPLDATSLIDEGSASDGRRKLAGDQFNHFGGFFDRAWRRNDLLWGRLDAAERLIESLLPYPSTARTALLEEAQDAIIEEEFKLDRREPLVQLLSASLIADETGSQDALVREVRDRGADALVEAMTTSLDASAIRRQLATDYEFTRALDNHRLLEVSGRATRVTGQILDGLSERAAPLATPARWIARTGRMGWWLAEVTTPRSWKQLLWRYWLGLLLVLSVLMIAGGTLLGNPEVTSAGWALLFVLAAGRFVVWVAEDLLQRRYGALALAVCVVLAMILVLAGIEVIAHGDEDLDSIQSKLPSWLGGD
jgi:patatin-related protein